MTRVLYFVFASVWKRKLLLKPQYTDNWVLKIEGANILIFTTQSSDEQFN